MSMIWLGIGVPTMPSTVWRLSENPNRSAATSAPTGFQRPRIIAASAMKPLPPVISLPKASPAATVKNAPPRPATAPPRIVLRTRVALTLMPTVSAAFGCSPTARRRRPQRLRNRKTCSRITTTYMRYTRRVWRNSTGPTTGICDSTGISMTGSGLREFHVAGSALRTVE
ncbi:Uncharacterised protein [Mycobacteroides abscessus]|nr:Uncharacterised protein [Mycobacteroides abscessus]